MKPSRLAVMTYGLLTLTGLSLGGMYLSMDSDPQRFVSLLMLTLALSVLSIAMSLALTFRRIRKRADRVADMLSGQADDVTIDPTDRMPR